MNIIKRKRIASEICKEISTIVTTEARDTILKTITITGAEVTDDLSFCKVFFTSMSEMPRDVLLKELVEAAPYIRKEISSRIQIRHTPKIVFKYDESVEYGNKIEKIIAEIHEEEKNE